MCSKSAKKKTKKKNKKKKPKHTRTKCQIYSKLTITTPEQCLLLPLLTLNRFHFNC